MSARIKYEVSLGEHEPAAAVQVGSSAVAKGILDPIPATQPHSHLSCCRGLTLCPGRPSLVREAVRLMIYEFLPHIARREVWTRFMSG